MTESFTIAQALKCSRELEQVSDSARIDSEVLLAAALKKNRTYLYTWPEKKLSDAEAESFIKSLQRRKKGEPIAYIVGEKEFWSLTLSVNSSTLIPRPDTELLVETALSLFTHDSLSSPRKVIDLGTGTGAVALALASEKPQWQIIAADNSQAACDLAIHNRDVNQLSNVDIVLSDWLKSVPHNGIDLIVSNPPYIEKNDPHLQQGDVRFEPHSALTADNNGLADIEIIIAQSCEKLALNGWLLIEHGYQQANVVMALLQRSGYSACFTAKDMAGHPRVTAGQWVGVDI